MKNTVLIILLNIIFSISVISQENVIPCSNVNKNLKLAGEKLAGREFINDFPTNRDQFFSDWCNGIIYLQNGFRVTNESITYNRYSDELLWLTKSQHKIVEVNKNSVQSFILLNENGEKQDHFIKMKIYVWPNTDSAYHFLQILAEGHITFYVLRGMSYFSNSNDLIIKNKYYLSLEDKMERLHLTKRGLLKIFRDNKKNVRTLLRKNHLSARKENDMIQFFKIYNKLQEN